MENRNVYKGHRYVPKIMGVWDQLKTYEGLSIVTWEGTSYTSKKRVPEGVDISNEEYWVVTGNYNAQVENYRQEVRDIDNRVSDNKTEIENNIEQLTQKVTFKNSVEDMKNATTLKDGDVVETLGYYEQNDGGGAKYRIYEDTQATGAITLTNGLKAVIQTGGKGNIRQFGAHPDLEDNQTYIQEAIDTLTEIEVGVGEFKSSPLVIGRGKTFRGVNIERTKLKLVPNVNEDFITLLDPTGQVFTNLQIIGNRYQNENPDRDASLVAVRTPKTGGSAFDHIMRDLHIREGAGIGLNMRHVGDHGYNWVHHYDSIRVSSCYRGIRDETTDNKYTNFYINSCDQYGLLSRGGSNLWVNLKIDWCGGDTNYVDSGFSLTTEEALKDENVVGGLVQNYRGNTHFVNLDVQSSANVGIKLIDTYGVKITGTINNNGTAYSKFNSPDYLGVGIGIFNSSGCTVDAVYYNPFIDPPQLTDVYIDELSHDNVFNYSNMTTHFFEAVDKGINNRISNDSEYKVVEKEQTYTNSIDLHTGSNASTSNGGSREIVGNHTVNYFDTITASNFYATLSGMTLTKRTTAYLSLEVKTHLPLMVEFVKVDAPYVFHRVGYIPVTDDYHRFEKIITATEGGRWVIRIAPLESSRPLSLDGLSIKYPMLLDLSKNFDNQSTPTTLDMRKLLEKSPNPYISLANKTLPFGLE